MWVVFKMQEISFQAERCGSVRWKICNARGSGRKRKEILVQGEEGGGGGKKTTKRNNNTNRRGTQRNLRNLEEFREIWRIDVNAKDMNLIGVYSEVQLRRARANHLILQSVARTISCTLSGPHNLAGEMWCFFSPACIVLLVTPVLTRHHFSFSFSFFFSFFLSFLRSFLFSIFVCVLAGCVCVGGGGGLNFLTEL